MNLTILHEYGARRHYEALFYLRNAGLIANISEVQFNLLKRALLYHDFYTSIKNLKSMAGFFFSSNKNLLIGAAPYDPIIPYLIRLKKRHNLIHHTSWPYWNGSAYPKKVIFPFQRILWKRYLENLRVVTVTKTAADNIERLGAIATYIPHSVNTNVFKPTDKNPDRVILFVGRLVDDKGVDYLIKLAYKWRKKDVKFWFVGEGNLKQQIERLQSKCSIQYFGRVTNQESLSKIYNEADIFVLPASSSYEELFGIVLIEAMSCGLPVVAADSVGPSEIVENGVNGYLVARGNEKELEKTLNYLLENPVVGRAMGKEGRKKVMREYSTDKVAKMWQRLLSEANFG